MTCAWSMQIIKNSIILKGIGFGTYVLFSYGHEYAKLDTINFRAEYGKLVLFNSVPTMYGKLVWRNFGKLVTSNKITGSEKQFNTLKYQRAKALNSFRHIALHSSKALILEHGTTLALHRGTVLARHRVTALLHHRGTASPCQSDPLPLFTCQKNHPQSHPTDSSGHFPQKTIFPQGGGIEKIDIANFPILVATNTYPQFFHQKCITFSCNLYHHLI